MADRRLHVVLVEPQFDGNLGFIARAIKNFGIVDLHLVNPTADINSDECRDRAVHAQDILDNARIHATFDDAAKGFSYTAAFAARAWTTDKSHLRAPLFLEEFAALAPDLSGDVALVFGREDDGLPNHVVERCDAVVTIPTHELYRSMNLSHAISVACYAVTRETHRAKSAPLARDQEKALLIEHVERTLVMLKYPEHRVGITSMAFQRLLGRAGLTKWEYHRMMGIFRRMLKFGDLFPELRAKYEAEVDGDEESAPAPLEK